MICPSCGHTNIPGVDSCTWCLADLGPLDLPVAQNPVEQSLMHDSVRLLEPRPPVTLPLSATIHEAIQVMVRREIGAVLVVDAQGLLHGILTERDLLMKINFEQESEYQRQITDFMTANPETIGSHVSIAFALHKMNIGGYRHLPVVANHKPIGTISIRDITRHMTQLCRKAAS